MEGPCLQGEGRIGRVEGGNLAVLSFLSRPIFNFSPPHPREEGKKKDGSGEDRERGEFGSSGGGGEGWEE